MLELEKERGTAPDPFRIDLCGDRGCVKCRRELNAALAARLSIFRGVEPLDLGLHDRVCGLSMNGISTTG